MKDYLNVFEFKKNQDGEG